tara:strand:+ start:60 stop:1043 length:984 start_codon:yes stop_codon:yes gene_type:complete
MKKKLLWVLGCLWMVFVMVMLLNSPRWAPEPAGGMKMIADRGVHHLSDSTDMGGDDCSAQHMLPGQEEQEIFENTVHSIRAAVTAKADMVEVDVAPTKDGKMVLFHDRTLDCRTNGKGDIRDRTLAELKALDIGHGYTADSGESFPLRGKGIGKIATVEEAIASETYKPFLFNFRGNDAAEADQLAAILKTAGRDPVTEGDGFYGGEAPTKRMAELFPGVWAWTKSAAKACSKDYAWMGWLGITPDSCKNSTLVVPLDDQWMIAGWPSRTIARINAVGGRIVIVGPATDGKATRGLTHGNQLADIPTSYNGYVMVDDISQVGPALIR